MQLTPPKMESKLRSEASGQLRRQSSRNRHRAVQGGSGQTPQPVENQRPDRMGDYEMGLLMQQRPTAWGDQPPNPERKGERISPTKYELEKAAQVLNKTLSGKPGTIQSNLSGNCGGSPNAEQSL